MTLIPVIGLHETWEEGTQTDIELRVVELVVAVGARDVPDMLLVLLPFGAIACRQIEDATLVEARRRDGEGMLFGHHLAIDNLPCSGFGEKGMDKDLLLQESLILHTASKLVGLHGDVPSRRLGICAGCCHCAAVGSLLRIAVRIRRCHIVSRQAHFIRSILHIIQRGVVVGKHRLLLDGHIFVDLAHEKRSLLGLMVQHKGPGRCHRVPVIAPPTLYHEQEVQGTVVLLVVLLEEIARILHEAAYLTGQKHLGQDVAVVVEIFRVGSIAHRDADRCAWFPAFHSKADRSERLCRLMTETAETEVAWMEVILATEEEAIGIYASHIIKYGDLANAGP